MAAEEPNAEPPQLRQRRIPPPPPERAPDPPSTVEAEIFDQFPDSDEAAVQEEWEPQNEEPADDEQPYVQEEENAAEAQAVESSSAPNPAIAFISSWTNHFLSMVPQVLRKPELSQDVEAGMIQEEETTPDLYDQNDGEIGYSEPFPAEISHSMSELPEPAHGAASCEQSNLPASAHAATRLEHLERTESVLARNQPSVKRPRVDKSEQNELPLTAKVAYRKLRHKLWGLGGDDEDLSEEDARKSPEERRRDWPAEFKQRAPAVVRELLDGKEETQVWSVSMRAVHVTMVPCMCAGGFILYLALAYAAFPVD